MCLFTQIYVSEINTLSGLDSAAVKPVITVNQILLLDDGKLFYSSFYILFCVHHIPLHIFISMILLFKSLAVA